MASKSRNLPGGAALALLISLSIAVPSGSAAPSGGTNGPGLSLADSFPPARLHEWLLPREKWQPYPVLTNRAGWQAVPSEVRRELLERGEAVLTNPVPMLPATLYLEYKREGNRARYEAVHRERRAMLHGLVLAECIEAQGRFLDAIANVVWAVCEESSWSFPSHIGVQKAGVGLPDVAEPIVDLFAAETGVSLAWTHYLLARALDKVSPLLLPRIEFEIQQRILTPVLARDFAWMGFNPGAGRPNNWNPWINASVLTSTLLIETNSERRVQLVHKTLRSLDRFVQPYPDDGSCDEGPGYWGHAGGSLFDGLDLLHSATVGRLDVFADPKIREIGRFIYRAHISGNWLVPVGDCPPKVDIDRGLVFRYGRSISDEGLTGLAADGATVGNVLASASDRFMGRQLGAIFSAKGILAANAAGRRAPALRDVWLGHEDMQMMTARSDDAHLEGRDRGLFVAAWGAHNAQSHNHNDVGNFIVFADGEPVLVDVGAPVYTAQTFSSRRYEIWAFQSAYHSLPTINGVQQSAGRQFAARNVEHAATDAFAELRMDIAPAYPAAAQVKSWLRTVRLNRGRAVVVTDTFEVTQVTGETTQNFITPLEVEQAGPGLLKLRTARPEFRTPPIRLEFNASLEPSIERIDINDTRLIPAWGTHLNRIILRPKAPVKKDTWTLTVRLDP